MGRSSACVVGDAGVLLPWCCRCCSCCWRSGRRRSRRARRRRAGHGEPVQPPRTDGEPPPLSKSVLTATMQLDLVAGPGTVEGGAGTGRGRWGRRRRRAADRRTHSEFRPARQGSGLLRGAGSRRSVDACRAMEPVYSGNLVVTFILVQQRPLASAVGHIVHRATLTACVHVVGRAPVCSHIEQVGSSPAGPSSRADPGRAAGALRSTCPAAASTALAARIRQESRSRRPPSTATSTTWRSSDSCWSSRSARCRGHVALGRIKARRVDRRHPQLGRRRGPPRRRPRNTCASSPRPLARSGASGAPILLTAASSPTAEPRPGGSDHRRAGRPGPAHVRQPGHRGDDPHGSPSCSTPMRPRPHEIEQRTHPPAPLPVGLAIPR